MQVAGKAADHPQPSGGPQWVSARGELGPLRGRVALVAIDHDHLVRCPAERHGPLAEGVLALGGLGVLEHLPEGGLADVEVGSWRRRWPASTFWESISPVPSRPRGPSRPGRARPPHARPAVGRSGTKDLGNKRPPPSPLPPPRPRSNPPSLHEASRRGPSDTPRGGPPGPDIGVPRNDDGGSSPQPKGKLSRDVSFFFLPAGECPLHRARMDP